MEVPYFGDYPGKRRREINLGGTSTPATSHASLLQDARLRRMQRSEQKRRSDSAVRIQRWWRGRQEIALVRQGLKSMFFENVTNLTGLRCLIRVGADDEILRVWSAAMVSGDGKLLLEAANDPAWHPSLSGVALLLLSTVARAPMSESAPLYLTALTILLSPQSPSSPRSLSRECITYLLQHGLYTHLGKAISGIPVEVKDSRRLSALIQLVILPFNTFSITDEAYCAALEHLLTHIMTITLLPNRLPADSLIRLSRHIPLVDLHLILITRVVPQLPTTEAHIHLLSNLTVFVPPRYNLLPVSSLTTFLNLTTAVMTALPPQSLEPQEKGSKVNPETLMHVDTDSDSEREIQVEVVTSFAPRPNLLPLDAKTSTRLQTLPSSSHLTSLLNATHRHSSASLQNALFGWLHALCTVWPSRRDKILGGIVAWGGGGLVRELYRGYVRSSPLGKTTSAAVLADAANAPHWPPLLFLVDLYNQALLTMGDEEFFSSSRGSSSSTTNIESRNPLTTDELTSFSRQLLTIAFLLYWREDQANVQDGCVPGIQNLRWEVARERMTKLLQAIHSRDSRRPFLPPDHWLMTSHVDIGPFVEAAVLEERNLLQPVGTRPISKRQITLLSPRLGVLNNIPFAIPFDVRVSIFRSFVRNDMATSGIDEFRSGFPGTTRAVIRREHLAEDGFDRLNGYDLKSRISITFVDKFGQEEAGIDGGGVFKEFLTSLCKQVFDTDRGLWLANTENELYPNPHEYATEDHSLAWYRFIGRILGKALYEGLLVEVAFAGFFLAKWLRKQSFLDDLASLDPDLYKGLIFLKHNKDNIEDLSLTFAVSVEDFGVPKTVPLMYGGEQIPVTKENRLQYIYLVADYHLNKKIKKQSDAFFDGLSEMIDPKWLRMFNQQELQILLGGVNSPIDLDDLRANTQYGGLYDDQQSTIQMFWKVVNTFSQQERRALLRFATSCSRPPLLGFKELIPRFAIRDSGSDQSRLPTASTCINLLKLPRYEDHVTLREKLLQAINSNAGFDLS